MTAHSDLNLDTKLELLRQRDNMEYRFSSSHPEFKDGLYKGQWRNALPHGRWVPVLVCVDIPAPWPAIYVHVLAALLGEIGWYFDLSVRSHLC